MGQVQYPCECDRSWLLPHAAELARARPPRAESGNLRENSHGPYRTRRGIGGSGDFPGVGVGRLRYRPDPRRGWRIPRQRSLATHGADAGGTRRFVACSKPYASSIRRGSLHAVPVKLTPNGAGFASNPSGNGGFGSFRTRPNGTITLGYPRLASMGAPVPPGNSTPSTVGPLSAAARPSRPAQ